MNIHSLIFVTALRKKKCFGRRLRVRYGACATGRAISATSAGSFRAHLPRIYEAASGSGHVIVLEEFIPGDNLSELCLGHTLDEDQVRRISLDICDALYVLHSRGLVHRDVKPENVILDGDRSVLIDFNTIRAASFDKTGISDTRILGTLGYAPPEQYGLSQTDRTADIYALGVLINVLLTGKHPSIELASGRWGRIVSRCTMTSPAKRYQSVQAIRESL